MCAYVNRRCISCVSSSKTKISAPALGCLNQCLWFSPIRAKWNVPKKFKRNWLPRYYLFHINYRGLYLNIAMTRPVRVGCSIPRLLMPWLHKSPGHQLTWCRLCRFRFVAVRIRVYNPLCHLMAWHHPRIFCRHSYNQIRVFLNATSEFDGWEQMVW